MSRQKVENCIQGTMSLLSHCLGKGENVALVLRDVGVLLIEGTRVQMKFYLSFLERMSGKENFEKATFKVSILASPRPRWLHSGAPALLVSGPPELGQPRRPGESYGPTNPHCLRLLRY